MNFGSYEVEGHLGAGGMSQVWLARGAQGLVVLKRQLNPDDDQRLRDEADVGMRLRHPSIVQTLDLFEDQGRPILVLEYVAGASLAALRKRGPLAPAAVCSIGADIADGLAALHGAVDPNGTPLGILHRDVSPANIIVSRDGRARLIDLGIARFAGSQSERTRTGDLRGTVRYLAPELFEGRPHSTKSDLWALGVCLFESALGRQAVTGPEAVILAAIVRGTMLERRPGEAIAPSLDVVLRELCAPEDARAAQASAVAQALAEAGHQLGDGHGLASVAVYATVEREPPRGPAADLGDDAFMPLAATTYCGYDVDDELEQSASRRYFTNDNVVTAATPSSARRAGMVPAGMVPAPVTVLSAPLRSPPQSSPGATPAGETSWDIPQPVTGEAALDAPRIIVDENNTAPEPRAQPSLTTEPDVEAAPVVDDPLPSPHTASDPTAPNEIIVGSALDDAALDELQKSAVGGVIPVIAAVVILAIVIAVVLALR